MSKTFFYFIEAFCSFALILDIASALNAARNHNLLSLILNILLIGLMIWCIRTNWSTYQFYKNKNNERGK